MPGGAVHSKAPSADEEKTSDTLLESVKRQRSARAEGGKSPVSVTIVPPAVGPSSGLATLIRVASSYSSNIAAPASV